MFSVRSRTDALAYVIALNDARRHLTTAQRAAIAADRWQRHWHLPHSSRARSVWEREGYLPIAAFSASQGLQGSDHSNAPSVFCKIFGNPLAARAALQLGQTLLNVRTII